MAKWEYEVVSAHNRAHLSDQLNNVAKEGWEPILYQMTTAPRTSSAGVDELHYVIIRRSPAPQ